MDLFVLKAVLGLDKSGYDKGIDDAKGKAEGFGSILKKGFGTAAKVGAVAITAASTAVVAFGKSAIDAGQTFDASMSQVAATMGYTVEQLNTEGSEAAKTYNTLREFAQKMGSETAFSASEAADALNYMALAGYDAETSMKMLPNVLNLASAGAMSLSSASDMVTDAQSALGLTLDETSALVDKMATTASKSNTSVSQLGEAILTIGGTANVLKGGTTELSAALGILADNGIKGAEGGTHLRNVLLSLSAPTDTAAETLASLGVKTTDASGNLRSLESIMGDLDKSLKGMGEADKAAIISKIFNKTDIAAVNALLSTSSSRWTELGEAINASSYSLSQISSDLNNSGVDWNKYASEAFLSINGVEKGIEDLASQIAYNLKTQGSSVAETAEFIASEYGLSMEDATKAVNSVNESLKTATGSAEAMAKTQLDNLAGDVTLFKSALEGAQIAISDGLTPTLRTFVQFGSSSLSTLTTAYKDGGLSGLTDAFGDVVSEGIGKLMDMLPSVIQAGTSMLTALIRGIISSAPKLVAAIPKLLKSLVTGIAKGLPQIGKAGKQLVTSLIQSIRTAFYTDVPSLFASLLTGGKVTWATGYSIDRFMTQFVKPALKQGLEKLFGDGSAANAIVDGFNKAFYAVTGAVNTLKNVFNTVVDFVTAHKDTIISVLSAVVGGFLALKTALTITDTIKTLKTAIGTAKSAITGLFTVISAHPMMLLVVAIGAVIGYLVNLYRTNETFRDKVNAAWETVKTVISGAWENTIKPAWESLKSFITDTLVPAFTAFWNDTIKPFGEYLAGAFATAWEGIKTFFGKTLPPIISSISTWFDNFKKDALEPLGTYISGVFIMDWEGIKTFFGETLPTAISTVVTWFTAFKMKTLEPLGTFLTNTFSVAWNAISTFFTETLPPAISGIATWFDNFKKKTLEPLATFLTGVFGTAWEGVKTFFSETLPGFVNTAMMYFNAFKIGVLKPLGDYIGGAFLSAWAAIKDYWETDLSPRLQGLKDAFDTFKQNVLVPIASFLGDTFKKAWEGIQGLFGSSEGGTGVNGSLKELSRSFHDLYIKYIKPVADFVAGYFSTVWTTWKGVINGVITFLTGVFTGDWKAAWQGLVDAFGSIFNGIKELVKKPLNAVIGFLNGLISKVELTINRLVRGINSALTISIPRFAWDFRNPFTGSLIGSIGFPGYNWRPGLPGVTFGRIPLLAQGGTVANGGHAIVGEAGAEYLRVVNGQAVVTPIKGMNGGGDTYNTINIYQQPGQDPKQLAEIVQRELVRIGRQQKAVYA